MKELLTENEKRIWKKVREVEIKTNKIINEIFSGNYRSIFKGKGLEFKEFKEYEAGDDPRYIDWKVTAKKGSIQVKKFIEERELTIILAIDISNSTLFGSTEQIKKELIAEFSASIAFTCSKNNDKVGLILFNDKIQNFIPPKKGKGQVLKILNTLITSLYSKNEEGKTSIDNPLKLISKLFRKKIIVFLVSDFMSENYEKSLKKVSYMHDLIAVIIKDKKEFELPQIGLIELQDYETGEVFLIDTNNKNLNTLLKVKETEVTNKLKKFQLDTITLNTDENFVIPLAKFFNSRKSYKH